jgi:integrin beta 8
MIRNIGNQVNSQLGQPSNDMGGIRPNPFSQVPVNMQGYLLQPGENDLMAPPATEFGNPSGPGQVSAPGTGGPNIPGAVIEQPFIPPGQGSPGMGGKIGRGFGGNMPQPAPATPLGVEQGGTPGRPVAATPMSPRGPGFANPGAPGVNNNMPSPSLTQPPLTPEIQPMPTPPMTAPGPMVNPRSRVSMQAPQSMKQGIMGRATTGRASRGAGRGGIMR